MKSNILILSDLHWHLASKKVDDNDIILFQETFNLGYGDRFRCIKYYWDIILKEKPKLVLLGGDLTGDGSCGHGFHKAFYYFLCLLNKAKIQTYFIQGDNDPIKYYSFVLENCKSLEYVQEISNQSIIWNKLRILGIPFKTTNKKRELKKLISQNAQHHDIILCHSALKRRTHLFDLDADLIITGHFDNKLCFIQNSIYLSLSNDTALINYVLISSAGEEGKIKYSFLDPRRNRSISYSESYSDLRNNELKGLVLSDKVPISIEEFEKLLLPNSEYEKDKNALALAIKFLRGKNYKDSIDFLFSSRTSEKLVEQELKRLRRQFFTSKHKLSKSMLLDFLGSSVGEQLK